MRWKIGVGVILVLLLAATLSMYRLWQEEKKESSRLSSNMKSLCTGLEEYKIRDSLNVVENHVLRLNIKELKELRSADAKLIKELNLRPKEVGIYYNYKSCHQRQYCICFERQLFQLFR